MVGGKYNLAGLNRIRTIHQNKEEECHQKIQNQQRVKIDDKADTSPPSSSLKRKSSTSGVDNPVHGGEIMSEIFAYPHEIPSISYGGGQV
ncbi:hypothetical protein E5676_scaffold237G001740 [Cucumis melo var. makuwa]|uniref:Uncharacterized protein n=1 Tax=Cucumis melo var. makuwa TaxID=1194695 RepID=A0A5D3DAH3_CUCMM|nr:hypothetical protein E6C27_scaffold36G002140 [Cucumis melo var. makuwa]TYK20577.1 hypothetical protein E5676_scaffold237G001740 [Cucumis melo var. makuwa]